MKNRTRTLLISLVMVITTVITVAGMFQERAGKVEQPKINLNELYGQHPGVDFADQRPESTDHKTRIKRQTKNGRYDKKAVVSTTPSKGLTWFGNDWDVGLTGIPVEQSDAVVVGEVLSGNAYLSKDKGAVYSEFTVRVGEVIKSGGELASGDSITADRFGGVVKYGPEHSTLYRVVGQDLPRPGRQYILFLKRAGEDQDYSIILGYELRADKVVLLDEIPVTAPYKDMAVSSFLKAIKDAVGQP